MPEQADRQHVHDDGLLWPGVATVEDGGVDAVVGLPARGLRQPNDAQARRAVDCHRLGVGQVAFDADDRGCACPRGEWMSCGSGHDVLLSIGNSPGVRARRLAKVRT